MNGMQAQRYRLIVFDWDGTLMDSAGQIVGAMQHAIAELGLPARPEERIRELIGLGLTEAMARLFPEFSPADTIALLERYRRHYVAPPQPAAQLFPGVLPVLDRLRLEGYRLAVATGKSRRGLDRAIAESGLRGYFETSRCADECASKPDPQMLHEILGEAAVDAAACLMVGDTEYDVGMAGNAGVAALGVAWGVHSRERLLQAGAVSVLPGVPALPDWLRTG